VTLLPGPCSLLTGAPEEQIADLLADPSSVRSVNRPVVSLADGSCLGYQASVRAAEWAARSPVPWFRTAAQTGLSGPLGALALRTALAERPLLPPGCFLSVELDPDALAHHEVIEVLARHDVADLMITLVCPELPELPDLRVIGPVLQDCRTRGLLLATSAGTAGLSELTAVERLCPDLILLSPALVRGVHLETIQQRLIDVVVTLADSLGAATLAEEVENLHEAQALRSRGVRTAHGWLFGRHRTGFIPPSPQVSDWLRAGSGAASLAAQPREVAV
jgi:EAL domain-containing protein (putative c-di-GMP-specific phosphodiesterase class I)